MTRRSFGALALLVLALAVVPGCIGLRSNTDQFLNDPDPGMGVVDMLSTYGKPDFATTVGDQSVYVYRVVKDNYYILFGQSDRFDLVVTCAAGAVVETRRVKLGTNTAVLYPVTWQVN